jgi:putative aldouronate transport system permease protein
MGLKAGEFSQATAIGLFQSVVSLVFLLVANAIAERSGEQGIW